MPSRLPRLKSETNQKVKVIRAIVLFVRIGEGRIRVMFELVWYLEVPTLLCMSFVDRSSISMFVSERKVIQVLSLPMLILMDNKTDTDRIG